MTKVAVNVPYWTTGYLSLRSQANEVDHPERKPFTVQTINLTRPRISTGPKRKTRPQTCRQNQHRSIVEIPAPYLKTRPPLGAHPGYFVRPQPVLLLISSFYLDQVVGEIVRQLEMTARDRNISRHLGSLPQVMGDLAMLKQVFVNLIGNAVKYTSKQERAEISIG